MPTATQDAATFVKDQIEQQFSDVSLVPPWVLRSVVEAETTLELPEFRLLRRECYVTTRESFRKHVDSHEFRHRPVQDMPALIILLSWPFQANWPEATVAALAHHARRLIFRGRMEVALLQHFAARTCDDHAIQEKITRLGRTEFDEIKAVLLDEDYLFSLDDPWIVYRQFIICYFELRFFAPHLLPYYFPILRERDDIVAMLTAEIDPQPILNEVLQLCPYLVEPNAQSERPNESGYATAPSPSDAHTQAEPSSVIARAERAAAKGNHVRAIIIYTSVDQKSNNRQFESRVQTLLHQLTDRLQHALDLDETQKEAWKVALAPLVQPAASGFWPLAARLLYDVQRVCIDREKDMYLIDTSAWLRTLGRVPIKREVPAFREVLLLKHLRLVHKRFTSIAMEENQHALLEELLDAALHKVEQRVRDQFYPPIRQALDEVQLRPSNLPEQVARDKICWELLDRVVEREMLTISDVRDALARNQLKLHDLSGPSELLRGDQLLQLDRVLARRLDGVYRPGEFYLRWLQSFNSLAFGTSVGRFITKYFVLPFGGAFALLKCIHGLGEEFRHYVLGDHEKHADQLTSVWSVGLLGLFILLMIHSPSFRQRVVSLLQSSGIVLHRVLIDAPRWFITLPVLQAIVRSPPFLFARRHLFKPLLLAGITALIGLEVRASYAQIGYSSAIVFLVSVVFFLTRWGRMVNEMVSYHLLRTWHDLRLELVPALFFYILDLFKFLLSEMERFLYSVDEWIRFKSSTGAWSLPLTAALSFVWSIISYGIRFLILLVIEPTINPIKHFPVVTAAGKLMLIPAAIVQDHIRETFSSELVAPLVTLSFLVLVFAMPGVIGFLVWELKESWRLYAANRSKVLRPASIGHHGETMVQLLRPGFHSGTIPKLYRKWRRAEHRHRHGSMHRHEHHLEEAGIAVHRLVERDFLHLLNLYFGPDDLKLSLRSVLLSTRRIKVTLVSPQYADEPLTFMFDLRWHYLLARCNDPSWLTSMRFKYQNAIDQGFRGLCKYAGVTFLHSQVEKQLDFPQGGYDLDNDKLIVWPDSEWRVQLIYDLDDESPIQPAVLPDDAAKTYRSISKEKLMFSNQPITWHSWVDYWQKGNGQMQAKLDNAAREQATV